MGRFELKKVPYKKAAFLLCGYFASVLILDLIFWGGDSHFLTTLRIVSETIAGCGAIGFILWLPTWVVSKVVRSRRKSVRRASIILGVTIIGTIVAFHWYHWSIQPSDPNEIPIDLPHWQTLLLFILYLIVWGAVVNLIDLWVERRRNSLKKALHKHETTGNGAADS